MDAHALSLFSSGAGQTMVVIEIGEEKELFNVHKDVLTASSPCFKSAFEGGFLEATAKSIHIPDITANTFKAFLDWLYYRYLPPWTNDHEEEEEVQNEEKEDGRDGGNGGPGGHGGHGEKAGECATCDRPNCLTTLEKLSPEDVYENEVILRKWSASLSLYICADRCNVPDLRKAIIDQLYSGDIYPSYADILCALLKLPILSPLIQIFKDLYVRYWHPDHDKICGTELLLRKLMSNEFFSIAGHSIVTVEVGSKDEKEAFAVHRDLLIESSPYFKAAFDGTSREAAVKSIHIEDISATTFKGFLD
ncbi:hypothetical protein EJ08DRAFT_732921 [Tothia fuscella]|uniref:BTB domain-containing protein n=1 Tax=Tothia fuscella TaxID=1048955 RepID=A0A9P4NUD9_9PEZI|nr:hypothetical protein EJ08DRAFT_732921 [Tothia fuscella]